MGFTSMNISDETLRLVQVVNSIIGTFSLIFLIIYVIKTWQIASSTKKSTEISERILKEMAAAREQEAAPYVVAFFELENESNNLPTVFFTIKNEGKTAAKNVKLDFDPPLPTLAYSPAPRNLNNLNMVKDGIPVMPPGFKIKTTFGFYTSLAGKGMSYRLKISFYGLHNEPEFVEYILDLSPFSDLLYDSPSGMPQLIEQVKKTHDSIDKIRERFNKLVDRIDDGLWVQNNCASPDRISLSVEEWKAAIHSKLIEYKLSWSSVYGIDYDKLNDDLFFSNLKNYYIQTGKYLLRLISLAPSGIPQGLNEGLISFSSQLLQVEAPLYVCREDDLDKYGNHFVALADNILKELAIYDSFMNNKD
jgi:hypothetical protein